MTLTELAAHLKTLGVPIAYSHFKSKTLTPFICYSVTGSDTITADDTVTNEITYVDIELYADKKELTLENKIKTLLKAIETPWSYDENFIESEGVFQCTFSIEITN